MTPDQNAATAARPTSTKWYWISGTLALIIIAGVVSGGATKGGDGAVERAGSDAMPASEWSFGTRWMNSRTKGWMLANGLTEEGC